MKSWFGRQEQICNAGGIGSTHTAVKKKLISVKSGHLGHIVKRKINKPTV